MEEEERAAQSAKLQELIRRGGPRDLQEANRLMKVMAGYDTRHKTDYRAKAAEEVGQIQQKARILEEMLQRHKPGDAFQEGDVSEVRDWSHNEFSSNELANFCAIGVGKCTSKRAPEDTENVRRRIRRHRSSSKTS